MLHLLLVGCGKMGGALLAGWQQAFADNTYFTVIDPAGVKKAAQVNTTFIASLDALPANYIADVVVLAVKPQQLDDVLPYYAKRFRAQTPLYLSIAAGKTVDYFRTHLGKQASVIRAMPNTPALVSKAMTVIYSPKDVPQVSQSVATRLMQASGKVVHLADETLMDAATAISGSGPAYVFLFLDALSKAGVDAGLEPLLARELALATVSGATALAAQSTDSFEQLRVDVTSPGGTTQAALEVLMRQGGLEALLREAVIAAKKRSQELKN